MLSVSCNLNYRFPGGFTGSMFRNSIIFSRSLISEGTESTANEGDLPSPELPKPSFSSNEKVVQHYDVLLF